LNRHRALASLALALSLLAGPARASVALEPAILYGFVSGFDGGGGFAAFDSAFDELATGGVTAVAQWPAAPGFTASAGAFVGSVADPFQLQGGTFASLAVGPNGASGAGSGVAGFSLLLTPAEDLRYTLVIDYTVPAEPFQGELTFFNAAVPGAPLVAFVAAGAPGARTTTFAGVLSGGSAYQLDAAASLNTLLRGYASGEAHLSQVAFTLTVQPIPEPSSVAMLLAGGALLAVMARRRLAARR
jgi:hypothetical protein